MVFPVGAIEFRFFRRVRTRRPCSTALEAVRLRLTADFPDVSKHRVRISPECRHVLDKMTASQAAERYQDYSDLIRDLEALADSAAVGRVRRWGRAVSHASQLDNSPQA